MTLEQLAWQTPKLITSPNLVLANVLARTIDLLAPRISVQKPNKAVFVVGTQINGSPHFGTHLVQTAAFTLAKLARQRFAIDTCVHFSALDNSPHEIVSDRRSGHQYQKTLYHALGKQNVSDLIASKYTPFLDEVSEATEIPYKLIAYSDQQQTLEFRATFIRSLDVLEHIKWWLSPSQGAVHLRVPCPVCGWAEKRAERTRVLKHTKECAVVAAHCLNHGEYGVEIGMDGKNYLDLSTLYRNVIKERVVARDTDNLYVMVKGGDWTYACQLVDGAHSAMHAAEGPLPFRIFTPQILSSTGAKLSKSSLKTGDANRPTDVADWMLDASAWPGQLRDYCKAMLWLSETLADDPRNFFRSFTTEEIARLWRFAPVSETPAMGTPPITHAQTGS
ncbi:hypothetical protein [Agrobacterium tumefaciens]|uniref:Uncharacterized protein n=1 Tax=Agrobacterium tumefaciens TaxID=358 RepID=A0AA44FCH8_AGRTU|nr:hypothetical protein [Agrobacterium tumefaciens]NTB87731.1 hypothetical protein [Agrobacterium tumefaciens]NTC32046.1 hypothetical protein [Agrobacterium tumefaciens]